MRLDGLKYYVTSLPPQEPGGQQKQQEACDLQFGVRLLDIELQLYRPLRGIAIVINMPGVVAVSRLRTRGRSHCQLEGRRPSRRTEMSGGTPEKALVCRVRHSTHQSSA